jgi:hypothetical protein
LVEGLGEFHGVVALVIPKGGIGDASDLSQYVWEEGGEGSIEGVCEEGLEDVEDAVARTTETDLFVQSRVEGTGGGGGRCRCYCIGGGRRELGFREHSSDVCRERRERFGEGEGAAEGDGDDHVGHGEGGVAEEFSGDRDVG